MKTAEGIFEAPLSDVELVTIERRFRNARAKVLMSHPFFGCILLKQKTIMSMDVETMATTGEELFFNPVYAANQTAEGLRFDVAHEALHPALCHHVRCGNRDFKMWNEACDYVINPMLVDAGFHLPEGALYRDDLKGKSAEAAYKILDGEKRGDDSGDDDAQQPEGSDGDASQPPMPRPMEQPQDDDDGEQGQGDGQTSPDDSGAPQDGKGEAGPDAPGQGQAGQGQQQQVPSIGGAGAVLQKPEMSQADKAAEENKWKVALVQAQNFQDKMSEAGAGDLPGDLIRSIEELTEPTASWRELLRRFMDQLSKNDFTWSVPNRRFIADGLYLPSAQSESMPPFLFVMDCSGSMPEKALAEGQGELQSIIDTMHPEFVDAIYFDTRVTNHQRFHDGDEVLLEAKGGGGTRFAPVCDWINDSDDEYSCIVWFTDMQVSDWDDCDVPDAPVLFVDWTCRHDDPHWGEEVIHLEDDWS